jgi:uncharacterized protein (DUF362 family)
VARGADVSLKVNLGWDLFIPGSITSPLVLEALIEEIRDHVGRIYVVEADQVLEDIESAFHASGMAAVCTRTGAQWVNMTDAPTVPEDFPGNVILKRIDVPRILRQTTLITVPVDEDPRQDGARRARSRTSGAASARCGTSTTSCSTTRWPTSIPRSAPRWP